MADAGHPLCSISLTFLTNLRSKVSPCTDALHWDLSGVSVGVHPNCNVDFFSETIDHRNLKLTRMVVCNEVFPKNVQFDYLLQRSEIIRGNNCWIKGPKTVMLHFSQTLLISET